MSLDDDIQDYKVARVSLNSDGLNKSLERLDLVPQNEQFLQNLVEEVKRGNQQNVEALLQNKETMIKLMKGEQSSEDDDRLLSDLSHVLDRRRGSHRM